MHGRPIQTTKRGSRGLIQSAGNPEANPVWETAKSFPLAGARTFLVEGYDIRHRASNYNDLETWFWLYRQKWERADIRSTLDCQTSDCRHIDGPLQRSFSECQIGIFHLIVCPRLARPHKDITNPQLILRHAHGAFLKPPTPEREARPNRQFVKLHTLSRITLQTPHTAAGILYSPSPASFQLRRGFDINAITSNGFTSLHSAAMTNRKEAAEILIENGTFRHSP